MKTLVRFLLAIAALVSTGAVSSPGKTQAALAARVDAVFADIGRDEPGCAVGVYRDGQVVLTKAYGVASVEEGRRITPTTTFNLGSAAKPFTAFAALLLEERRRLTLDDDVRKYVP
ncbi:MAG: serine hydrolase, partial [Vicinamibacterales bacterium]